MQQHFEIIGSGVYLPREVILSRDLDRKFGLEPGWTEQRTGVRQRHRRAPDEHATDMGKAAALAALADARITLAEIDLILDASTCQQQPLPCNAALLNQALGHEAAGIPFTLHHVRQRIPRDERVLLIGTAAGYAQAAMIFTL